MDSAERTRRIAEEALNIYGTYQQVAPFSSRYKGFDLAEAYAVATLIRDLRSAKGENAVGRKIGFTNRAVWAGYGISGPIWNYMFDTTVSDLAAIGGDYALNGFPEPRIEPEIVLHLASAPHPGMDEAALLSCIDWVAHGFEIVHSIFPDWTFTAADAVAAYGVHNALILGDRMVIAEKSKQVATALSTFTIDITSNDGVSRHGYGNNVLGGPLKALHFLVEELARYPASEPLRAGEIITTGTLTEAMPATRGQTWSTSLGGIDMGGLKLTFS